MLKEFLFIEIEEEDIGIDGATCHTVEATVDVLRPASRANVVWPSRSCEGAVKDKC